MPDWNIIAIEEHFTSPRLLELIAPRDGPTQQRLNTLTGVRIKEMDDAGIDLAVLSENAPAANNLPPDIAGMAARASNDFLHATIRANPTRFAGFATLPFGKNRSGSNPPARGLSYSSRNRS